MLLLNIILLNSAADIARPGPPGYLFTKRETIRGKKKRESRSNNRQKGKLRRDKISGDLGNKQGKN